MEAVIFKKILLLVLQIDCAMSKGEEPWVSIPLKAHLSTLLVARSHGCTVWHTPSIKTPRSSPDESVSSCPPFLLLEVLVFWICKGYAPPQDKSKGESARKKQPTTTTKQKNAASRTIKG